MKRSNSILVSAIATTLNCREGLRECIEQISRELDGRRFVEIVVVDGGSTDGTWELLDELAQTNRDIHIFQEVGANISRGRNLAVEHARGNVIMSFDSGCRMVDGFVTLMAQPFVDDPDCEVVGAKTVAVGNTVFEKAVACLERGTLKDLRNPSSRGIALRKEVFEAIGGYDESVLAGEDTHFNWKWRNAGYKYVHVPEAKVFWRVRPSLRALYRMQRRNVTGSIVLRNPWSSSGWATRLNIVCLLIGVVGVGFALTGLRWAGWVGGVGFAGWLGYVLFRTMRRNRWRCFIHPAKFACVVAAMFAMDMGTWNGTINGWIERRRRV